MRRSLLQKKQTSIQKSTQKQANSVNAELILELSPLNFTSKKQVEEAVQTTHFKRRFSSTQGRRLKLWKGHLSSRVRIILFNWMSVVASQKGLQRETYALATLYMDSYVEANPQIKKKQLQLGAFACLSLAGKIQQSTPISKDQFTNIFSLQDLEEQETRILKKLGFRLNPDTYVFWLGKLMHNWDHYIKNKQSSYGNFRYSSPQLASFVLNREVYEMGQIFNSCLKSTQYNVEEISLNLFYVVTKKNALKLNKNQNQKTLIVSIMNKDQFYNFYQQFLESMQMIKYKINENLVKMMCRLFTVETNLEDPEIIIRSSEDDENIITRVDNLIFSIQTDSL